MMINVLKYIKSIYREHFLIFIFAMLIGLIMVVPQLIFIYQLGDQYQGIYMMKSDGEPYYLARMREIYDGNGWGNPYIYEGKSNDIPSAVPSVSETILTYPGKNLNISAANINLFYKFLLPAIIFLLVYSLFFRITGSKLWSIGAGVIILSGSVMFKFNELLDLLKWQTQNSSFALYARPINPQLSSILFFSYLHVFLSAVREVKAKYFIWLAVVFSALVWIYFYGWTFVLCLNFVAAALFFLRRNRRLSLGILSATFAGLVIGLPAIIELIRVRLNANYNSLALIQMATHSRAPIISTAGAIIVVLFLFYFFKFKNERSDTDYFFLSLLIASFTVVNQQILTGMVMQEGHYHWYFNLPIFTLIFLWVGYNFSKKSTYSFLFTAGLVFLIIISFANLYLIQKTSFAFNKDTVASQQNYSKIFNWLNTNTQKEDVILADAALSELIPVYTQNNVFWAPLARVYLLPEERMNTAFFAYLNLYQAETNCFQKKTCFDGENMPIIFENMEEFYNKDLSAEYQNFQADFYGNLKKYKLNYIVWDTVQDKIWNLEQYEFLKLIYSVDNFKIYQIN